MGYLPQFLAGDATTLGKSLVIATPTQAAARDLIGLGESDIVTFNRGNFSERVRVGAEVAGNYIFTVNPPSVSNGWIAFDAVGSNQPRIRMQTALIYRGSSGGIVVSDSVGTSAKLTVAGDIAISGGNNRLQLSSGVQSGSISTAWNTADTHIKILNTGTRSTSLRVVGGLGIGTAYENTQPPANGAIIEGNLGIGHSSPISVLDVAGNGTFRNGSTPTQLLLTKSYTSSTNYEGLRIDTTDDAYRIGSAVGSAGGTSRDVEFGRLSAAGAWQPGLIVKTNGNLIVGRGATGTGLGGVDGSLRVASMASFGTLGFTSRYNILAAGMRSYAIDEVYARDLRFYTKPSDTNALDGQERMRITHDGRILMGTTSDDGTSRLRVSGSVVITGGLSASGTIMLLSLPESDPGVAGQLWNDNGNPRISAGA